MKRLGVMAVFSLTVALLASGCLWGRVTDVNTGASVSGGTVTYTDSRGNTGSSPTGVLGMFIFDHAAGDDVPVPGYVTFQVTAPGCLPLTEERLVDYLDNPTATDLMAYYDFQRFSLWCVGGPPAAPPAPPPTDITVPTPVPGKLPPLPTSTP